MSERMKVTAKTEAKKDNPTQKAQNIVVSHSVNSPFNFIMSLHRTVGNQAVQRLFESGAIQAKLHISQPGDVYEQEADRVAGQVMRMTEPALQRKWHPGINLSYLEYQEEKKNLVNRKIAQVSNRVLTSLSDNFMQNLGSGQPLDNASRAYFEPLFRVNFSDVRIHTGNYADKTAKAVNARAFTIGRDVVFGAGEYTPGTMAGKRLMAHELTHVVQQQQNQHKNTSMPILQRELQYIKEVKDKKELKIYMERLNKSILEIEKTLAGINTPEAEVLRKTVEYLKDLITTGQVKFWYTSGENSYGSVVKGKMNLHINTSKPFSPDTLIHETIHVIHAKQYPKLHELYINALKKGEIKTKNFATLLLKYKAWEEYWAWRWYYEYYYLRLSPENRKDSFYTPHNMTMREEQVKDEIKRIEIELKEDFKPWEWTPPAIYRAKRIKNFLKIK